MKKASILSFQFADNFGALLQIYALSETLSKYDLEVEVINFRPTRLVEPYLLGIDFLNSLKIDGTIITAKKLAKKLLNFKENYNKKTKFNDFRNEYLNITKKMYKTSEEIVPDAQKYDYCFVGSDQVWNPSFFKYAGKTYFLDYAPESSKKISYAASIAEDINSESKSIFEENLAKFNSISVRERSGKSLLEGLSDNNIEVTLDPTLLLSKEDWIKLIHNNNIFEKFILVYDMEKNDRVIKLANEISKKTGYKIVSFSDKKGYNNWYFSFSTFNPVDFIKLYNEAQFVITSSFHGTAFAILFEKQFYTISHSTRGSRMVDLLTDLGLKNRLITRDEQTINLEDRIDYSEARVALELLRKKSISFIENSLN